MIRRSKAVIKSFIILLASSNATINHPCNLLNKCLVFSLSFDDLTCVVCLFGLFWGYGAGKQEENKKYAKNESHK